MPDPASKGERIIRGIGVSAGVCRGRILVLSESSEGIPHRNLTEEDIPHEIHRLEHALVQTRKDISEVQRKVNESMGADDARILDSHTLVLEDPTLLEEVT